MASHARMTTITCMYVADSSVGREERTGCRSHELPRIILPIFQTEDRKSGSRPKGGIETQEGVPGSRSVPCTAPWGACCCLSKWLTGCFYDNSFVTWILGTTGPANQRWWGTSERAVRRPRLSIRVALDLCRSLLENGRVGLSVLRSPVVMYCEQQTQNARGDGIPLRRPGRSPVPPTDRGSVRTACRRSHRPSRCRPLGLPLTLSPAQRDTSGPAHNSLSWQPLAR